MKKRVFIFCLIIFIIELFFLFYNLFAVSFVSQNLKNVDKIIVLIDPNQGGDLKTIRITERDKIKYVYDMLKETEIEHTTRWPDHLVSIQFDAEFVINVEYQNGEMDRYTAPQNDGSRIYRYLKTKGNNNDPGYVVGFNNELWDYIISLK